MHKLKIILLLSFISSANFATSIISPALPQIQHIMHLNNNNISLIVSVFLISYVLGQLFYGVIAGKIGQIKALRWGMIIYFIGVAISLISAYNLQFFYLLLGRFIASLGASSGLVCTIALINNLYTDKSKIKQLLSYTILSFTVAMYLGAYLGGVLTAYFGWQATLYGSLVHAILLFIFTFIISSIEKKSTLNNITSISSVIKNQLLALKNIKLISFSLIAALSGNIAYLYAVESPLITHQQHNFNLSAISYGRWNCLNAIGMILGAIITNQLLKIFSAKKILIYSIIIVFIFCIFSLFMQKFLHPLSFFTITTGIFLFSSAIYPCAIFYASNNSTCKSSAAAMSSFINMLIISIFVTIIGLLRISNFDKLFVGLLIYSIFCLILCYYMKKTNLRENYQF